MKILIADNSFYAPELFRLLTQAGMMPLTAGSAQDAFDLFLVEQPDLVFLDNALPEGGAAEFMRGFRALEAPGKWTPVFLLLPRGEAPDELKEAFESGVDDVLYKPVNEAELAAKMVFLRRLVQMGNSLLALTHKLDTANHELKRLSSLDRLTGLASRSHFEEMLEREWRRSARQRSDLALLMCDIDYFDAYNSVVGHVAADDTLRSIARLFGGSMERGGDSVARYGGQKFAVLLPMTGLTGAAFVAERIRRALADLRLPHDTSPFGYVTASFGVAACVVSAENRPDMLIDATLLALNQAKQGGRNCVRRILVTETGAFETQKDFPHRDGAQKEQRAEQFGAGQ